MDYCKYCAKRCRTERGDEGFICCTGCGRVIDSDMYSSEPTFIKGPGGQSQLSGKFVKSVENGCSESHQRTLDKGRDEISYLVENLNIAGGNSIIDQASAFYRIAVDRNFTKGRRTSLVAAACLYIACRENKKAYLLIDFSEDLRVNVYALGAVFLQLCQVLRLEEHPIVQKLVDPSLFIHRFTERLLGGKNDKVSRTALRILASMKRDWMQTGRKPSGLCGAALYISAHSYGLKCSKSDIGSVVHICEATLTKRLIEFENTESGSLTIEEFNTKAEDIERESGSRQLANVGVKSSGTMELLCEHKGSNIPHFAHGLCRGCYDDFVELSGGLLGGSDPPAFQRAERERMAKESALEKAKEADVCEKDVDPSSLPNYDRNPKGKMDSQQSEAVKLNSQQSDGVSNGVQDVDGSVYGNGNEDVGDVAGDEEESLSDIDDAEVSGYLHDEDEKRLKTIIWETLNKEYLEEEAAKQAAKEAFEAKFQNGSEDSFHARELAQQALDNVAKSRKEKRRQRALEAKNAPPAQNATEAAHQMLKKKKLSSRINYDVLNKLFEDDPMATDDTNKRQNEFNSDDDASRQKRIKETEPDDSSSIAQEDEDGEEYPGNVMYGEVDMYVGNEDEDYGEEY